MGKITTDHIHLREGAAPDTPASGEAALYVKSDGNPYLKTDDGTEVAVLTDTVSVGNKALADDTLDAWSILEGANTYLTFSTVDGSEKIQLGDSAAVAALELELQAGTGGLVISSAGTGSVSAAGALALDSTGGAINIGTGDYDQAVNLGTTGERATTVGSADGAASLTFQAGTAGLSMSSTGTTAMSIADNSATAWQVAEDSNSYIKVVTTDSSEAVEFGNAVENPTFAFLGSGQTTFSGPVDVDAAFTGTGAYSYSQTVGTFTYDVNGAAYTVADCSLFTVTASGGTSNAIRLLASGGGGFDFDAGTAGVNMASSGPMVFTGPDNTGEMWKIEEGSNAYITCVSTDGAELVRIDQNWRAYGDSAIVDGVLQTKLGIDSGEDLTVGGTAYVQDTISGTISDTTTETAFDKASQDLPANSLGPGRRLRIHAVGSLPDTADGTQALTLRLRLYSATGPTTLNLMAIVANDTSDNDIWEFDAWLTVRTIGTTTTRTVVVSGGCGIGVEGSFSLDRRRFISSASFDQTKAYSVEVTAQWTNADAANQVVLDDLLVELH